MDGTPHTIPDASPNTADPDPAATPQPSPLPPPTPPPTPPPAPEEHGKGLRHQLHELGILSVRTDPTNPVIINCTGRRIGIERFEPEGDERNATRSRLILPPFGERQVSEKALEVFDCKAWAVHDLIEIQEPREQVEEQGEWRRVTAGLWLRLWAVALFVVLGLEVEWLGSSAWYWLGLGGIGLWTAVWLVQTPAARVRISRMISFWVTLTIGVGSPVAAEWLVGGGWAILGEPPEVLVVRATGLVFVSVAAVLPALLYYLFDRQQLATLRESFYRNVIELEPKILTMEDAKSIYGGLVAEVYGGPADADPEVDSTTGSRLPIIIATVLLTAGWLLVLPPRAVLSPEGLLVPTPSAMSYGFLGAYFFSVGMILRRYTRSDLKPKTYGHITVRLLVTVVLVWALSILPVWGDTAAGAANAYLLVLSFMVGIVPDTGLMVIRQFLSTTLLKVRVDSLGDRLPLHLLDGITLYDQARLAEEGIENIQNLVYYNLAELVLQTRIPLPRLIDWVDQGILVMHIEDRAHIGTLRGLGIRNASDLQATYAAARERGDAGQLIMALGRAESADLPRLQLVYDALQNDEWFENVMLWRERARLPGEHVFTLEEVFLTHDELCAKIGRCRPATPEPAVTAVASPTVAC